MTTNQPTNEEPNVWQRISDATGTLATPANAIDAIGFAGAKYGLDHLDSWKGIATSVLSFTADIADGKIARATGTTSHLGEAIDAVGDKAKLGYAIYKINELDLASKALLRAVAIQNGCNTALTAWDQLSHKGHNVLHSSWVGKRAILMQQLGIGTQVIAAQMEKDGMPRSRQVRAVGSVIGWSGVGLGVVSTLGYVHTLQRARQKTS